MKPAVLPSLFLSCSVTLFAGQLPLFQDAKELESVSLDSYLKQQGWTGEETEYAVLHEYLSFHNREEDGRQIWNKKYYDFGRDNLNALQQVRNSLAGKPEAYIEAWVAWFAPRMIGYRIPYNMELLSKELKAIPDGKLVALNSVKELRSELESRYSFSKLSSAEQSRLAAALAGINPGILEEGGLHASLKSAPELWQVAHEDWSITYDLPSATQVYFPSKHWLLTQKSYQADVPTFILHSAQTRSLEITLPKSGPRDQDVYLRLDVEGDQVTGAMARLAGNAHRVYQVIPLEMDAAGKVVGPQTPAKSKAKAAKVDLHSDDLMQSIGGSPALGMGMMEEDNSPKPGTGTHAAPFQEAWLRKEASKIQGAARILWGEQDKLPASTEVQLKLNLNQPEVEGQAWTRHIYRGKKSRQKPEIQGPLKVTSAEPLPGTDAIAGNWRTPWGEDASAVASERTPTLLNPQQATLAWVSQDRIPIGRGPNTRGASRPQSVGKPLSGGWGSPVLEDNRIFLSYFKPSGDVYAYGAKARKHPLANLAMDMMRVSADEFMHAFDAESGKSLWKLQLQDRGLNWMGFNKGGPGSSASVKDGIAVWLGSRGEVYAVDAASGTLLWINDIGLRHEQLEQALRVNRETGALYGSRNDFQSAVLIADGVAVVSDHKRTKDAYRYERECGLMGFDLKTGRLLWHQPEIAGSNKFNQGGQLWKLNGKAVILASDTFSTVMLDPRTGNILAKSDELINRSWGFIGGEDIVLGDVWVDPADRKAGSRMAGFKVSEQGFEKIWMLPKNFSTRPGAGVYQDGRFYVSASKTFDGLAVVDAQSGQVLATENIKMGGGEHAPFVISTGHSILGTVDRTNGLIFFNPDPAHLTGSAKVWYLDLATGYCGSVVPIIADGRLIIRAPDRLLCFDLRK